MSINAGVELINSDDSGGREYACIHIYIWVARYYVSTIWSLPRPYSDTNPGGTYHPNEPLVMTSGATFKPLDIPKRDPVVRGLLDTALGIF